MNLDLETIQEMWKKDSKIDIDNLHIESSNIPQLHSKYYNLYNTILLLQEKANRTFDQVNLERYNYYTGKAEPEIYAAEPFPYKIRDKETLQKHLNADEKLSKCLMKVKYYNYMLKFLEDILKIISNRTFQIKNSIDFMKFSSGA